MKFIGLICFCTFLLACSPSSKNKTKEKIKTFATFCKNLKKTENLTIDSLSFAKVIQNNPFSKLNNDELALVNSSLLKEKCADNSKYIAYSVGKLTKQKGNIYLILYLTLNSKCQYDGYENLFILCNYDSSGNFLSEKIIGKRYLVFGAEEYSYFDLVTSRKIIQKNINAFENEFGKTIIERSKDTLFL
ncbi:MAG: hypothetical protein ACK5B9_15750 [Flavobacteriia bacterium]|jgi:predicted acetyltransferase